MPAPPSALPAKADAYETLNFRTVGKSSTAGELKRGAPARKRSADFNAGSPRSPTSIPSKLETVLFRGQRKHKGFGSQNLRFGPQAGAESPGPGSYAAPRAFHEEVSDGDSWGVRGTGGFASKSRRFRSLTPGGLLGGGGGSAGPGPGAYEQLSQAEASQHVSKAGSPSSAFAPPQSASPRNLVPRPTPGPGQYNSPREAWGSNASRASAAFKSGTKRGVAGGALGMHHAGSMPGPGTYDVAEVITDFRDEALSESFRPGSVPSDVRGCQNRMFKGPTPRRLLSVHPDMPVSTHLAESTDKGGGQDFVRECKGSLLAYPNPPPGHYTPDDSSIRQAQNFSSLGSSMFVSPGSSPEPRKRAGPTPGPGQYLGVAERGEPLGGGAGSAFKSCVVKKEAVPIAPGPAFYRLGSSRPDEKKSFHLNMSRKWI